MPSKAQNALGGLLSLCTANPCWRQLFGWCPARVGFETRRTEEKRKISLGIRGTHKWTSAESTYISVYGRRCKGHYAIEALHHNTNAFERWCQSGAPNDTYSNSAHVKKVI
jgi:hypothetical protein